MLAAGQIVDDRYEIRRLIGYGGMSSVFEAWHLNLNRAVAVKILKDTASDTDATRRLQREAQASAKLQHPNIVEIFGFGHWNNQAYIAMELLEGESLAALLERETRLSPKDALPIFAEICDGLAHAHSAGVIHRDVKPSNIMLVPDANAANGRRVKIVDFGIAKLLPESGAEIQRLTQTGALLGTLLYASPEQCMGKPVDTRSDIYSLGILMYEVIDGRCPMQSESAFETLSKHLSEPLPESHYISACPYGSTILWCARKDALDRPHNAAAVKNALLHPDQTCAVPTVQTSMHSVTSKRRSSFAPVAVLSIIAIGAAIVLAPQHFGANRITNFADAFQFAQPYYQRRSWREALQYLLRAEQLVDSSISVGDRLRLHHELANCLIELNEDEKAFSHAKQVVDDPSRSSVLALEEQELAAENLSVLYERRGDWAHALEVRKEVLRLDEIKTQGRSNWARRRLASDYNKLGQWDAAIPLLKRALELSPRGIHADLYLNTLVTLGESYMCKAADTANKTQRKELREQAMSIFNQAAAFPKSNRQISDLVELARSSKEKYANENWYVGLDRTKWTTD